jgi:hypothetical protein
VLHGCLKEAVPAFCRRKRRGLGGKRDPILPRPDMLRAAAGLRGRLPGWVNLPPSVTVPFGACEEALAAAANAGLRARLEAAVRAVPDTHAEDALAACRDLIMQVRQLCRLWCTDGACCLPVARYAPCALASSHQRK